MNSKILLTTLLLLLVFNASAQIAIGANVSMINPTADIGPNFKKAPCYEVFQMDGSKKVRFRQRFGFIYTSMQPRLDSFPTYVYRGGDDPKFFAGKTVYSDLKLIMIYGGVDLKILELNRFRWYGGVNIVFGLAKMTYARDAHPVIIEEDVINEGLGGFMFRTSFEYSFARRFDVFAVLSKSSLVGQKWSPFYGHYNYGIGLSYLLIPDFE